MSKYHAMPVEAIVSEPSVSKENMNRRNDVDTFAFGFPFNALPQLCRSRLDRPGGRYSSSNNFNAFCGE